MPLVGSLANVSARGLGFTARSATVPGAVQSLTLSASDRTITATWSAPVSDGGSPITSYTVETQRNSEGWVSQGSQSSGVSFTVRNNTAVTARSYKVRVTANNSVGAGLATESAPATPNFGTPATPSGAPIEPTSPNNGSNGSGARQFSITYSPLVCAAFSSCEVWIARSGYEYQNVGNNVTLSTALSTANQTYTISSAFQTALGWYTPTASIDYYVFTRTYNSDGDYKDSAVSPVITTAPTRSYTWTTTQWAAEQAYSAQTGVFTVTGNTFSQTSVYSIPGVNTSNVGDVQYRITNVTIQARTGSSGTTICTSSRYFFADFSGTSTTAGTGGGSKNGLAAPWSTNSGTTYRPFSTGWAVDYGAAGGGRLRVRGAGSIGTWSTSPDQRIYVYMDIVGFSQTRTSTTTYPTY